MEFINNLLRKGVAKGQSGRGEGVAYQPKPDPESWIKAIKPPERVPYATEETSSMDIPRDLFKSLGLPEDFQDYEARNRLKTYSDGSYAVECIGIDKNVRRSSHVDWSERRFISPEDFQRVSDLISQKR